MRSAQEHRLAVFETLTTFDITMVHVADRKWNWEYRARESLGFLQQLQPPPLRVYPRQNSPWAVRRWCRRYVGVTWCEHGGPAMECGGRICSTGFQPGKSDCRVNYLNLSQPSILHDAQQYINHNTRLGSVCMHAIERRVELS